MQKEICKCFKVDLFVTRELRTSTIKTSGRIFLLNKAVHNFLMDFVFLVWYCKFDINLIDIRLIWLNPATAKIVNWI